MEKEVRRADREGGGGGGGDEEGDREGEGGGDEEEVRRDSREKHIRESCTSPRLPSQDSRLVAPWTSSLLPPTDAHTPRAQNTPATSADTGPLSQGGSPAMGQST